MDEAKASQVVRDASQILNGLDLFPFLTCGTLLGYHREGGFIDWDQDLDVGVFVPSDPSIVKDAFIKRGYKCVADLGANDCGKEYGFKKHGLQYKIDVFFYYYDKDRDLYWQSVWKGAGETEYSGPLAQMIKYNYFKFGLKEIEFYGCKMYVPDDVGKFIEMQYGPNWRIPDKNWGWWKSPFNLEKTDVIMPWKKLGWYFDTGEDV